MSFHLKDLTWAQSDDGESVTVPGREIIRYEGPGVDLTMPYGAGGAENVLYLDELHRVPSERREKVRQAIDEAAALLFKRGHRWA